MKSIQLLKQYKQLCSDISDIQKDILFYNELLLDQNLLDLYEMKIITKITNKPIEYLRQSTVEKLAFKDENTRKAKYNDIKSEIKSLESELKIKKHEKNKIDELLIILSSKEFLVIELRYFDNLDWNNIEMNYNNKNKRRMMTIKGLQLVRNKALEKIEARFTEREMRLISKWAEVDKKVGNMIK
jgi:hypothetical protein